MPRKKAPYVFIITLVIVLFFVVGFRAGQSVEKTNKANSVLLSLPPSRASEPTGKPLAFASLTITGCGTSLLYPNSITLADESTQSAQFIDKGKQVLRISCVPWTKLQPTSIPAVPTGAILGRYYSVMEKDSGFITLQVKHPSKNILITIEAKEDLLPYVVQNLELAK